MISLSTHHYYYYYYYAIAKGNNNLHFILMSGQVAWSFSCLIYTLILLYVSYLLL